VEDAQGEQDEGDADEVQGGARERCLPRQVRVLPGTMPSEKRVHVVSTSSPSYQHRFLTIDESRVQGKTSTTTISRFEGKRRRIVRRRGRVTENAIFSHALRHKQLACHIILL